MKILNLFLIVSFFFVSTVLAKTRILVVDEINEMHAGKLKLTAVTARAGFPSGDLITTSVGMELQNKQLDNEGRLIKATILMKVFQHSKDSDQYEDQIAHVHCLEIDIQENLKKVLSREGISNFNIMGLTLVAPSINFLGPSPVRCEKFDLIEVD